VKRRSEHGVRPGTVGSLAEEAASTCVDRADRNRSDHQLHRIRRQFSIEVNGVFDVEHDARLRRFPGSAGIVEGEPAPLDEGAEGFSPQRRFWETPIGISRLIPGC
jgi:hypothetical protein